MAYQYFQMALQKNLIVNLKAKFVWGVLGFGQPTFSDKFGLTDEKV